MGFTWTDFRRMLGSSMGPNTSDDPVFNFIQPESAYNPSGTASGVTAGPRQGAEAPMPSQSAITGSISQTPPPVPMTSTSNPASFNLGTKTDDSDIRALLDQLNKQGGTMAGDMQQGLGDKEQMLKAYLENVKPGVDISPLMALADTWYGGNLSKGYAKPMSGMDVLSGQQGLQGQVDKARLGVRDTERNALKDELSGRLKLRELEAMEVEKALK
jgi:hypothetical protein